MDGNLPSVSLTDLHGSLGTASAPVVVDVRRVVPDPAKDRLIVAALHRPRTTLSAGPKTYRPIAPWWCTAFTGTRSVRV
jgi:hypothetical protein